MGHNKSSKRAKLIDNSENFTGKRKYDRVKRYPYKLYIPETLDMEEILDLDRPTFKYYLDCFIYILHLIVSIPLRLKDYDVERQKGFTPIKKEILSKRIHNYIEYVQFLLKHGIIEEGTSHLPGVYSRGLKYSERYRTKVKGIYITKNTLIKSITERHDYRDIEAEEKLWFLKKWFNPKLTIDMEKVEEFLEEDMQRSRERLEIKRAKYKRKTFYATVDEIVTMGYNMKFIVADRIKEGKHYTLTVDNTSGRFHSPITQLKKGLRKYVKYNGETLYSIDIVNSQPLLALIVLDYNLFLKNGIYKLIAHYNENHQELKAMDRLLMSYNPTSTMLVNLLKKCHKKNDVQFFKDAVISGHFYEFFGDLLLGKGLIPYEIKGNPEEVRSFAKTATFTAFFSRIKDAKWNVYIQAFRKCFPTVFRIFNLIKSGKNTHHTLACLLQRFESNLVLHDACVEINSLYPNVPIFTIHDSIATTEGNVQVVEEIFRRHISHRLGITPQLKIEKW